MLCDAHVHFIPEELSGYTSFYKGVWADKEKLFQFLEKNNIKKAFLVYPSTDAHIKLGGFGKVSSLYNNAVAEILRENERVVAACLVDVENLEDVFLKLGKLKEKGFRAVSISSSCKGAFIVDKLMALFDAAEKHEFPVFVHPQTINPIGFERVNDPLLMPVLEYSFDLSVFLGLLMTEGVLDKFNVKFIFSSLGGVVPFLKDRFDRVYSMLRGRGIVKDLGSLPSNILRKVYVDTSGASLKNIGIAIDLFGEDKILWGSDYPVNLDVEKNVKMLDELGPVIKNKIISGNFTGLFGL